MMRPRLPALLMTLILLLSAFGAAAGAETAAGERITLTIHAPSLAGSMTGEKTEQRIDVYLPPSYDHSGARYPVVYFLPGFGDSVSTYSIGLAAFMDELLEDQAVREMIIVTVEGRNVLHGSFYTNSPVTGNWEDFVTQDVIGYVDQHFRTIPLSEARGIAGHSMGGSGVISIAMHTQDVFGAAYSMSPGLFAGNGLEECDTRFSRIQPLVDRYQGMDAAAAKASYAQECGTQSWPNDFAIAYASAFAPDPDGAPPYVKLPERDRGGQYLEDDVYALYEAGFGNLERKLDEYGENLANLRGFVIDYGTNDEFRWIPKGCEYFSELLTERGIAHELIAYEGGHSSKVASRLPQDVLPFFSEILYDRDGVNQWMNRIAY